MKGKAKASSKGLFAYGHLHGSQTGNAFTATQEPAHKLERHLIPIYNLPHPFHHHEAPGYPIYREVILRRGDVAPNLIRDVQISVLNRLLIPLLGLAYITGPL